MKKNANIITGALDLAIVISAFVLQIWDYAKMGYGNLYSLRYGTISTIELFDKSMYNDEVLHFSLIGAFVVLVVSAILMFMKKYINIAKVAQFVASVVVAVMYFLVHIEVFSFIADYSVCELNVLGFVVVVICIANALMSMIFLKEETIETNEVKENEHVL